MSFRVCAFLTLDEPGNFSIDDDLVLPALEAVGWRVESVPWRADVDWDRFEAVVIRTPWDYQEDPQAFLRVLETIDDSSARLENPLSTVRWNLHKTYLQDLESRGVQVVPTVWGLADPPTAASLRGLFQTPELAVESVGDKAKGIVIKPVVSANADDTFWLVAESTDEELARVADIFTRVDGTVREYMAQPFVPSIVDDGEVSLIYFAGELSHGIQKVPKQVDFRVQEEHGGAIESLEVNGAVRAEIVRCAQTALDAIEPLPLYARVDLVRLRSGDFAVMEVELIEPSLYFRMDAAAPGRFARAFLDWMGSEGTPFRQA